mmetsp:Transcript_12656/g.29703  ORF Transcript_12656/g.29703 Transcript_12656/m.29703 type:complete len:232 (-) Transcript_12656:144-839(-)
MGLQLPTCPLADRHPIPIHTHTLPPPTHTPTPTPTHTHTHTHFPPAPLVSRAELVARPRAVGGLCRAAARHQRTRPLRAHHGLCDVHPADCLPPRPAGPLHARGVRHDGLARARRGVDRGGADQGGLLPLPHLRLLRRRAARPGSLLRLQVRGRGHLVCRGAVRSLPLRAPRLALSRALHRLLHAQDADGGARLCNADAGGDEAELLHLRDRRVTSLVRVVPQLFVIPLVV